MNTRIPMDAASSSIQVFARLRKTTLQLYAKRKVTTYPRCYNEIEKEHVYMKWLIVDGLTEARLMSL